MLIRASNIVQNNILLPIASVSILSCTLNAKVLLVIILLRSQASQKRRMEVKNFASNPYANLPNFDNAPIIASINL